MAKKLHGASSHSEPDGFRVGMTGGIGSGKTAVADMFAQLGAAIIDTDVIARSLTARGGAAIEAIRQEFGTQYLAVDGALDRPRMRELVFRNPAAKARLESILHPRIRQQARVDAESALKGAPYVIFVVPLLVESGHWRDTIDRLLVIDCAQATQLARVCTHRGLDVNLVRGIIAHQASRQQRLDAADDILVNDGALQQLPPRVARLHRHYFESALEAGRERL